MRRPLVLAWLVALSSSALMALSPPAPAGRGLFLGFDDDTLKWMHRPNGLVGVDRELGVGAIRITIPWHRGESRPHGAAKDYLDRAAKAIVLGQRIVIAVYGRAADAPADASERSHYCHYVEHIVRRIPQIRDVVIWNEANSPRYWPARLGAPTYERLLATCWDVLHARARRSVNVIDSTASHYDPVGFIEQLGAAYRASGRLDPIVDTFGHNPYPETAAEPPSTVHEGRAIVGEGDYATLMGALSQAFFFTPQPVPTAYRPTLWYLEDGFQTSVPAALQHLYTGRENDPFVVPPVGGQAPNQADQLRAAVSLAYCQPAVGAFFNFQLLDERRLAGWQSGLLYTNGMRKPSFLAFRALALDVRARAIDCAHVLGAPLSPPRTHKP